MNTVTTAIYLNAVAASNTAFILIPKPLSSLVLRIETAYFSCGRVYSIEPVLTSSSLSPLLLSIVFALLLLPSSVRVTQYLT